MNDNNVNKLIAESILKLGSIVSSDYHNEDPFWEDTDYLEHRKNCNLVLNGSGAPTVPKSAVPEIFDDNYDNSQEENQEENQED